MGNSMKWYICAVLVAAGMAFVMGRAFSDEAATYVGNKQCKICHNSKEMGEIWNIWKASQHAKAFELLGTDAAKAVAAKLKLEKPPTESPQCLQCHVTAYDVAKGAAPETIMKEDGVQCESCHGPASLHMIDGKKFMMTKDTSMNMWAHIVKPDEQVCKKCHNDKSPTWKPDRYTLADGSKTGFDFKQAWEKIKHAIPNKPVK